MGDAVFSGYDFMGEMLIASRDLDTFMHHDASAIYNHSCQQAEPENPDPFGRPREIIVRQSNYTRIKEDENMTDTEVLQALKDVMKPMNKKMENLELKLDSLELKLDNLELKLEALRLDNKMEHRAIRKDIDYLNDEMETVITVLQAKDILPKAQ